jgi:hypothetical protein
LEPLLHIVDDGRCVDPPMLMLSNTVAGSDLRILFDHDSLLIHGTP